MKWAHQKMQHIRPNKLITKSRVSRFMNYELTTFLLAFFLKKKKLTLVSIYETCFGICQSGLLQEMSHRKLYLCEPLSKTMTLKETNLLCLFSNCRLSNCALHKYAFHEEQWKWMKVNSHLPVKMPHSFNLLISLQTPSLRKFSAFQFFRVR